jgi:hypothetical protein
MFFLWNLTYDMRNVNGRSKQIGDEIFISNYLNHLSISTRQNDFELFEYKDKMLKYINTIWKS